MPSEFTREEGGAALVEAALVLPVLLVIVFGLMELGLYGWTSGLAGKAVQLGVRRAIVSDAVAIGPGLDPLESAGYWNGLPPGQTCFPRDGGVSPCPSFAVTCDLSAGCRCAGDACRFQFAPSRLAPILTAMRAVMPDLRSENVRISYTTNGLGYVQRPGPVPVDIRVSLIGLSYKPILLADLFGGSLPLRPSAARPSEDLTTAR